ncbi:MAG: glycosyltransferase [Pseudobutyrivibrio ruminis]|uniref:Glycosyltransferase n=1 Tax=Pseudobutyrivibrio ruminis TaxID=46206 RepID=A0A927U7J5_9FIRM|nr:glycosyltransferase [Pseudobutyrivibrio ruminis]
MKVLEVNFADLMGHIFNGYDLMNSLNLKKEFDIKQVVEHKKSENPNVLKVSDYSGIYYDLYKELENRCHVSHLFTGTGEQILQLKEYQEADIVHFHILHNRFISLLDYPDLFNNKKSIWTIHDPWILTANCVYPLECQKWKTFCDKCPKEGDFRYGKDNLANSFMWDVKKNVLASINPHIVVSCDYMKQLLEQSPLTKHLTKIHEIPFGIDAGKYVYNQKIQKRKKYGLSEDKLVIGFRTGGKIKGGQYLYKALKKIKIKEPIELVVIGGEEKIGYLGNKIKVHQLGWLYEEADVIDFLECCDIFAMPSLAETFGLMAIEAMAAGCAVICFNNTILEKITNSPKCGVAADYCSVNSLKNEIERMINNPDEIKQRGKLSRKFVEETYKYDDYVRKHAQLYKEIYEE